MATVEELLTLLSSDASRAATLIDEEPSFSIIKLDRTVEIPENCRIIGTNGDHNSEIITFKCPRIIDGHDISECDKHMISWLNAGYEPGHYIITDVEAHDDGYVYFTWTIDSRVSAYIGTIEFAVHFIDLDTNGVIDYRWSTAKNSQLKVVETVFNEEDDDDLVYSVDVDEESLMTATDVAIDIALNGEDESFDVYDSYFNEYIEQVVLNANESVGEAYSKASTVVEAYDKSSTVVDTYNKVPTILNAADKANAAATSATNATTSANNAASAANAVTAEMNNNKIPAWQQTVDSLVDGTRLMHTENRSRNNYTATAEGDLVHVEDAYTTEPREVVIHNEYVQDGTPTPDNPIEIKTLSAVDLCVSGADTSVYDTTSITLTDAEGNPVEVCPVLPDGTQDELVLTDNGDGTATKEVVKRFGKVVLDGTSDIVESSVKTVPCFKVLDGIVPVRDTVNNIAPILCDKLVAYDYFIAAANMAENTVKYSCDSSSNPTLGIIYLCVSGISSVEDMKTYLDTNPITVYYPLATEKRINCGTVPISSLPESITNMWASADVPTTLKLTYELAVEVDIKPEDIIEAVIGGMSNG